MPFAKGCIVIFGEAAMLTAQNKNFWPELPQHRRPPTSPQRHALANRFVKVRVGPLLPSFPWRRSSDIVLENHLLVVAQELWVRLGNLFRQPNWRSFKRCEVLLQFQLWKVTFQSLA